MYTKPIKNDFGRGLLFGLGLLLAPVVLVGGCLAVATVGSIIDLNEDTPQVKESKRLEAARKAATAIAHQKLKQVLYLSEAAEFTHPSTTGPIDGKFVVMGFALDQDESYKYAVILSDNGTTLPDLEACMVDGEIIWDASPQPQ